MNYESWRISFQSSEGAARQAFKLWKEALEQPAFDYNTAFSHGYEAHKAEQPAYETESWKNNMKEAEEILAKAKFANEQPAQEPVAWRVLLDESPEDTDWHYMTGEPWECFKRSAEPLYTHPAPSWQELSEHEIWEIECTGGWDAENDTVGFARAIEQALRNKNGF